MNENQNNNVNKTTIEKTEIVELKNRKSRKNSVAGIIIILVIIIGFVIALPYVEKLININNDYHYSSGTTVSKDSENLIDGLIPLNKIAYMKVRNIRFYDFKKNNNVIKYTVLPEENIASTKNMSIIVQLYDNNKELIYKENFDKENLSRGVLSYIELANNENVYENANYAKVIINNNGNSKTSMSCTKDMVKGNAKTSVENIFYFTGNYLSSYDTIMEVYAVDKTDENYLSLIKEIEDLNSELLLTNIDKKTLELNNNKIIFTIDVDTFNNSNGKYEIIYNSNYTKKLIKTIQTKNGWACE